jgi:hypothetical protein
MWLPLKVDTQVQNNLVHLLHHLGMHLHHHQH